MGDSIRQEVQLPRFIWKVLAIYLFTFGGVSFFPFAAVAQTVYQPNVPPPANPASVAAPHDDWYMTVQQKFDHHSGKHADIIFDGDFITNRWEITGKDVWARYANRAAVFGIEGDRTENLLWRLRKGQVDGVDPKLVVLLIGANDVEGPNMIAANFSPDDPFAKGFSFTSFVELTGGKYFYGRNDLNHEIKKASPETRASTP